MKPSYIIDLHPDKFNGAQFATMPDVDGELRQVLIIPCAENGIFKNKRGFWRWRLCAFRNDRPAKPFYIAPQINADGLAYLTAKGYMAKKDAGCQIVGGVWLQS